MAHTQLMEQHLSVGYDKRSEIFLQTWTFQAIDTLFFRDGTPFHLGETFFIQQKSQFPPLISTLQGAIRTSLARTVGWSEGDSKQDQKKKWPIDILGDGSDDLGQLQLRGPYLEWKGNRIYPLPLVLCGEGKHATSWILPGTEVECDLGSVYLPYVPSSEDKPITAAWVNEAGLQKIVQHEFPSEKDILLSTELWKEEPRIGIKRENTTRQVKDGHLYAANHIRPLENLRLVVEVDGVPSDWNLPNRFTTILGGEGRFAEVTVKENMERHLPKLSDISADQGKVRFTLTLITPGKFHDMKHAVKHGPIALFSCKSASIGKMITHGGWDLQKNQSKPVEPFIPAGTTWFYEVDQEQVPDLKWLHGTCVGEKREYGYGEIVIGRWE
jgi:CRISPR-associated protein Cmr3